MAQHHSISCLVSYNSFLMFPFRPLYSSSSYCCFIVSPFKSLKISLTNLKFFIYPHFPLLTNTASFPLFASTHIFHSRMSWTIRSFWLYFMFLSSLFCTRLSVMLDWNGLFLLIFLHEWTFVCFSSLNSNNISSLEFVLIFWDKLGTSLYMFPLNSVHCHFHILLLCTVGVYLHNSTYCPLDFLTSLFL